MANDNFQHLSDSDREIIAKYGEHFNNTGGNDPLDILNDFKRPNNRDLQTNIVRYLLGMAVHAQVGILAKLEQIGSLPTTFAEVSENNTSDADSA